MQEDKKKILKLQNIIYPSTENCTEELLFFRRYGNVKYFFSDAYIVLNKDADICFDTYFNGFSIGKWLKYTLISNVGVAIMVRGKFRLSLLYREKQVNQILSKTVGEKYINTRGKLETVFIKFDTEYDQGMYAFSITSLKDGSEFHEGYYFSEESEERKKLVALAIIICTFKREKYIYKNMKQIGKELLENPNSELYHNLDILISDNGGTLDLSQLKHEHIHVYQNKNLGGSGGFTRGLIEAKRFHKKITHVILMDDDVVIQPESIYRTYRLLTLLKPQYQDSYIGGAMLRTDNQWYQTEAGAVWNNGNLISMKQGLDLRTLDACLYNEFEEKAEFNAWWYCTIPMFLLGDDNLPLPIFIRGDDVEYGLRNMTRLILVNGICVWHEPFEFKYNSAMYYYIFRNRLIDNAVRNLSYDRLKFIKDFRMEFFHEVFTLRYKNAWLLLQGIDDFMKGIDWLKNQDGEELNQWVIEHGYRLQYVDELDIAFSYPEYEKTLQFCESRKQQLRRKLTLNGFLGKVTRTVIVPVINPHIAYFHHASRALNYDITSKKGFETYYSRKEMIALGKAYMKLVQKTRKYYDKVCKEYEKRKDEIMSIEFWKEYLGI